MLREGDRTRSEPLRPVARQAHRRPIARPIPSRTKRNIPASRSARAARTFRSARTTAMQPASSACGCSPIPTSTKKPPRNGTPKRYYNDPSYYLSKDLVRPYRVGMSCGFCHVGPNPVKPPADPEHPEVGEPQLERRRAVLLDRSHFRLGSRRDQLPLSAVPHLAARLARYVARLHRQHQQSADDERGLHLGPRLEQAKRWGKETLAGGGLDNKQFNDYRRRAGR